MSYLTQLEALNGELIDLLKTSADLKTGTMKGQEWRADMKERLQASPLSVEQVGVLREHASPSLKMLFNMAVKNEQVDMEALSTALTHAFQDSLGKVTGMIGMVLGALGTAEGDAPLDMEDRESVFRHACMLHRTIKDLQDNYRMILPVEDVHDHYSMMLDLYRDRYEPALADIVSHLPEQLGLPDEQVTMIAEKAAQGMTQGREHITAIPQQSWQRTAGR